MVVTNSHARIAQLFLEATRVELIPIVEKALTLLTSYNLYGPWVLYKGAALSN